MATRVYPLLEAIRTSAAEVVEPLVERDGVRVERIISSGQRSPEGFWYDQDEHEWVTVLSGRATVRFEGEAPVELGPGDAMLLPAHQKHRVESTSTEEPTVWLAIFWKASPTELRVTGRTGDR